MYKDYYCIFEIRCVCAYTYLCCANVGSCVHHCVRYTRTCVDDRIVCMCVHYYIAPCMVDCFHTCYDSTACIIMHEYFNNLPLLCVYSHVLYSCLVASILHHCYILVCTFYIVCSNCPTPNPHMYSDRYNIHTTCVHTWLCAQCTLL